MVVLYQNNILKLIYETLNIAAHVSMNITWFIYIIRNSVYGT